MSPDGVHDNEMPKLPDDQRPADDPVLASFAEDLRIVAGGPAPEPRSGLVAVMRQGAVPVEPPAAGRKRKMLVKTVVGGLAAKLALGMGVAAASVTAAGAAGVLPDPAQHAVASVVAAATPFTLPDPSDLTTLATQDEPGGAATTTTTSTTLAGDDGAEAGGTGTRAVNHGACVSTAARDKSGEGNHGKTVSSVARTDCGKEETSATTTTTIGGGSTTTTLDDGQRRANSGPGSANSGRGNSGNGGGGNSGGGSGGNGADAGNGGQGNRGRN